MTARIAHICRHPIKGHGREDLAAVMLTAGDGLPWDRHWAVAHEQARLVDGWNPCANFARGAKAPALMAVTSQLDEATGTVTLNHPGCGEIRFRPDDPTDLPRFLDWARPLNPPERAQPARIVTAGRAMTDSEFPSISIFSLASNRDLGDRIGAELSPHRWRGNIWLDGVPAFAEFGWIGKRLQIGDAVLVVRERITRCRATMANPDTGTIDADTLGVLEQVYGHQDFGVYAQVVSGSTIRLNDPVTVL